MTGGSSNIASLMWWFILNLCLFALCLTLCACPAAPPDRYELKVRVSDRSERADERQQDGAASEREARIEMQLDSTALKVDKKIDEVDELIDAVKALPVTQDDDHNHEFVTPTSDTSTDTSDLQESTEDKPIEEAE